ncbi:WGxxGxxG-CTERM domain-containing protein [Brevibacillus composti]|uniref:WGxxGxxG-CTERM domain-containing protein n=2 Tax=Brevibacillus composti TaxID=2796470 RepID=A0A7T5JQZ1_9BACL|nr:WGxxGxxG-CTERM domain-containing protein [Brevibacillus composti]QUO43748.1 WGxxGxxG-CTERM domain-containing protein [Brevibacillus composti]
MGASAFAETGGAGNTGGTNAGMTGNTGAGAGTGAGVTGTGTTGANQGYNNMYRTTAADNDTDWGWIGLLGLAGLAGLMGRNRNREMQR